jgi:hypothetical protein
MFCDYDSAIVVRGLIGIAVLVALAGFAIGAGRLLRRSRMQEEMLARLMRRTPHG